jgi:formate-dependent nitrite reductase membrane component NrfD
LVTNFASWLNNPMYTQNFSGLLTSYIAGIPFFRNTLLGDLFYLSVLFGTTKVFGVSIKPMYER